MSQIKDEPFSQKLLGLVCDLAFIKFINIQTEPNIFKIVGRAHYERWHSAFWGWLFDKQGSHLLSDYVLTRILFLIFHSRTLKGNFSEYEFLLKNLPTIKWTDVQVTPNENISTETSITRVGRFDIFLTADLKLRRVKLAE